MHTQPAEIRIDELDPDVATAWAETCLEALTVEYPYSPGHVMVDADDHLAPARNAHPAFHGALDWHSACHLTWSLLQLMPLLDSTQTTRVTEFLACRLTVDNLRKEAAYFTAHQGFERPYGWAWYLKLTADAGPSYRPILDPLARQIEAQAKDWLDTFAYPIRHGMHTNSAFGLSLMLEAAVQLGRDEFAAEIRKRSLDWFVGDRNYCAEFEPSGADFLSPALSEAMLMGLVLDDGFPEWLARFLPSLANPDCVLRHVPVLGDDSDGHLAHLYGLCLTRSWQLSWLGHRIGDEALIADASRQAAAARHVVTNGDFMSTHWLVTYALLAETSARPSELKSHRELTEC